MAKIPAAQTPSLFTEEVNVHRGDGVIHRDAGGKRPVLLRIAHDYIRTRLADRRQYGLAYGVIVRAENGTADRLQQIRVGVIGGVIGSFTVTEQAEGDNGARQPCFNAVLKPAKLLRRPRVRDFSVRHPGQLAEHFAIRLLGTRRGRVVHDHCVQPSAMPPGIGQITGQPALQDLHTIARWDGDRVDLGASAGRRRRVNPVSSRRRGSVTAAWTCRSNSSTTSGSAVSICACDRAAATPRTVGFSKNWRMGSSTDALS